MQEPTPEQYNPPLTWRSHAWRTAGALSISAVLWPTTAAVQWHQARPLFWLDLTLGLLTLVLSFGRRRWPFAVASLCAVLGAVSVSSAGPGVLASVSLATRRHVPQIVAVGVLGLVGAVAYPMVGPSATDDPWWITFAFGLAFTVAMLVWGMYLGSRRSCSGRCATAPSGRRPSRDCAWSRAGPPSGPGSPARCTTCWRTGSA